MSTEETTQTSITLEKIESEIKQIDQLIHSWSNGRSLRFDPAHVKQKKEAPAEPTPQISRPPALSAFFWFNFIALVLPLAVMMLQSSGGLVSSQLGTIILTGSMMLFAGGNLAIASYASAVFRKAKRDRAAKNAQPRKKELSSRT